MNIAEMNFVYTFAGKWVCMSFGALGGEGSLLHYSGLNEEVLVSVLVYKHNGANESNLYV